MAHSSTMKTYSFKFNTASCRVLYRNNQVVQAKVAQIPIQAAHHGIQQPKARVLRMINHHLAVILPTRYLRALKECQTLHGAKMIQLKLIWLASIKWDLYGWSIQKD